ncbi:MAG: hypothetical protein JW794_03405 [Candidatus Cloacimonetes bacterium]|nr:hypothetical protein [Candidatus Cloacimonadota bacterium]
MEWIVPFMAVIILLILFVYFLVKKSKSKEDTAIILITLSLLVYHLGDLFLWSGWIGYEIARRIASIGFYFEIPFMLLLMYWLLPAEKRQLGVKIISAILLIPWIVAIIMIGKSPIVFLEGLGTYNESFVYILILCFLISIVFIVLNAFRAKKFREDALGKKLSSFFAIASIIFTVLYLIIFSSIQTVGVDLTWLFGIISIFYVITLGQGSVIQKK